MKKNATTRARVLAMTSALSTAFALSGVLAAQSQLTVEHAQHGKLVLPIDVQIETPNPAEISDLKLQSTIRAAIDEGLANLHKSLSTLDAKTQSLVAEHAKEIIASVDVNEIRETVRRAMEEAGKAGSFSYRISGDEVQKGNPYASRETREFKQVLGDGTVIARQSTRLLARDGEGRTRQELRQPDGTARIFINDPVAKRTFIIDPQKRVACKAGFDKEAINDCFKQMRGDWKPLGFSFSPSNQGIAMMTSNDDVKIHVSASARVLDFTKDAKVMIHHEKSRIGHASPLPPVPPLPPSVDGASASTRDSKVVRENNNTTYEGLRVETTRSVETIAIGAMGNNRALETVFERYYSPDLKMTVFSRRSDPRSGESIYRMTEIKRSEPDASLFRAPSGFNEVEGKSK